MVLEKNKNISEFWSQYWQSFPTLSQPRSVHTLCCIYGEFHGGWRMTNKIGTISFYGEAYIFLNISIEVLQLKCMYKLSFLSSPHDFFSGLAPVKLV